MSGDKEASLHEPGQPVGAVAPQQRRRLQFSLATLLWLTTLAACLVALGVLYRDLQQARTKLRASREEVQEYRSEMGYLVISDPKKIYARGVRTIGENKWAWRIRAPQGSEFFIHLATESIPAQGVPTSIRAISRIKAGEHIFDAYAEPRRDGKWQVHASFRDADKSVFRDSSWFDLNFGTVPLEDVITEFRVSDAEQVAANARSPLVLLKLRKGNWAPDPKPCDGLMIWIEAKR